MSRARVNVRFVIYCVVIIIIIVYVAKCEFPMITLKDSHNYSSTILTNFSEPAMEGSIVHFSCPQNLQLSGPDTATCMRFGQWYPNASEVECKG